MKTDQYEEPPIGLKPEFILHEHRVKAILEAALRYQRAGKEIPSEWVDELIRHNAWLRKHDEWLRKRSRLKKTTRVSASGPFRAMVNEPMPVKLIKCAGCNAHFPITKIWYIGGENEDEPLCSHCVVDALLSLRQRQIEQERSR